MTKVALFLMAALLASCTQAPKRVESLGLPPAAPNVALVVIPTENTRNAIEYNRLHGRASNPWDPIAQLNKEQPLNTLVSVLRANFKSVVKVDSLNQAKALHPDAIGMLDYYFTATTHVKWGKGMEGGLRIDEALLVLDAAGKEIVKIAASGSNDFHDAKNEAAGVNGVLWPFTHFAEGPIQFMWVETQDDVLTNFATALSSSPELRRFDHDHAEPGAPSAAAVASSAAPKESRSGADSPRYRKAEDQNKFALVVGLEDYQSLPAAAYAERDARSVRAHLLALGYPDRNVILLAGREGGKAGLEKYLDSWLPRNVDDRSRVFVYFAGYGATDAKTGQRYLMPWDADAKFVDSTGYAVKELYAKLAALKAKRITVAFDAGFSGAGGRSVLPQGARPLLTRVDASGPISDKLVVLEASGGDEVTGAAKEQGHGLFTYYLLEGLNERSGDVSPKALYEYAKPRVQDAARRDSRDQTPRLTGSGSTEDVL